ncbi:MDR family MFS transporter [Paenibacillus rigui]|uniref:MFS transporter n=1 Tax=Paenibacillus rigui TaxID=554312 RepID=A0A229UK08_9BACL|nr:MDR family MFS transporter [Paenibacillus rigui]OXM83711.1 MFS transporter [Paenibacillus rigui]
MTKQTNRRNVAISLFIATFLAAIEGTIVSTAMPGITEDLGGIQLYSWVISVYLLTTVISTPIYGKLSDLFGRKPVYIAGTIIFLLGSTLSGVAHSMTELVWYRAVQGLGAGSLITLPYAIIGDLFPFEMRAKIQGWTSSVWGIAGIVGPLAGGLLVDYVSWRWIFFMNLPFAAVSLTLLWIYLHETPQKKKPHIDYPGIVTFSVGMFCFLYATTLFNNHNGGTIAWGSVTPLLAVAVVLFILFFRIELRSPEPMIPLKLFRIRTLSLVNSNGFLLAVIQVVVVFYLPLWVQGVMGSSATYSGIAMLPMMITWPAASIMAGQLVAKLGVRRLIIAAVALLFIASAGLTLMDEHTSTAFLMVLIGILGAGFGLSFTSFTITAQSAVGRDMRGAAIASHNLIRTLGQTIGIAVFGMIVNTGSSQEINSGLLAASLHVVYWVITVIAVAAFVLSLLLPKQGVEAQGQAKPTT